MKKHNIAYNGYRFKSKVEARWAAYFDSMGIEYSYEPQDYQLSNGYDYTPPFYLIDLGIWVEVKNKQELKHIEFEQVRYLCKDTKKPVVVLKGDPALTHYTMLIYDETTNSEVDTKTVNMVLDPESDTGLLTSYHLFKEDEFIDYGEAGIKAVIALKNSINKRFETI